MKLFFPLTTIGETSSSIAKFKMGKNHGEGKRFVWEIGGPLLLVRNLKGDS